MGISIKEMFTYLMLSVRIVKIICKRTYCMSNGLVPFWENAYQDENAIAFSVNPNATIKEFEHLFDKQSQILEVGCGEGQNIIYLAEHGFANIDAFDLSSKAINKVMHRCEVRNVKVNAFIDDLKKYHFDKKYDWVMSFGTLHFVKKNEWKKFICNAKENTNVGGIHIMQIFTDVVPVSDDIAPFAIGIAKDKEIKELYQDWEILQFRSYVFEDEHPNVPKHLHASNKIVVRKK